MQNTGRNNLASIALLVVSGSGLLLSLGATALLGVYSLINLLSQALPAGEYTPLFTLTWVSALMGLLALPAVVLSVLRLMGRPAHLPSLGGGFRLASILLVLWPLALALGSLVAQNSRIAWLLLPPLHLLAIGLPIWWLVETARRQLSPGSQQRGWGLLSASLFVTTPSVIVFEIILLIVLVILFAILISLHPEWISDIQRLAQRLTLLQNNPDAILNVLKPVLQSPLALFGVLALLAGLIPMLEELLKPLALWLFAGSLSPSAGFAAGAICGGAFALTESLMTLSSASGEGWLGLAIARAGTGMLHITTSALMGWGLASAWRDRAYLKLGLSYFFAVLWHGSWNALSILSGIGPILALSGGSPAWVTRLSIIAPPGLLVLVISLFLFLSGANRILFRQDVAQAAAQLAAQLDEPVTDDSPGVLHSL